MSIEKLSVEDTRNIIVIQKLNELIDAHNELEQKYAEHYHETLDTHYNTTSPKYVEL